MLIAIPSTDMGTCCKAMAAIVTMLFSHSMTLLFDALPATLHGRGDYPGSISGGLNGTHTTKIRY